MEEKQIIEKIVELRKSSKKRAFSQTFDLIVNLKNMDLKKPDHKVDLAIALNSNIKPKKLKICAVIDHSITGAEQIYDKVIYNEELSKMKGNLEEIRKITHVFDKFVVQVNHMPVFAQVLGKFLGPMNKMPSPKLGMVITPKTNLEELNNKIQKTVHFQTKKNLVLQASIGSEEVKDEELAKSILTIYEALKNSLPNKEFSIKNMKLKLTMSKSVEIK
jgi:large subunit ribosomal protein L1